MATAQMDMLGINSDMTGIDLPLLVQEATWKEVLIELVHKNQFDPWNIDIGQIVDKYIETVKALRVMDLRVPANIILASAVLLRLKSEMLTIVEPEPEQMEGAPYERPDVQVDALALRPRPQVKRKIALVELIRALDEAMAIKERRDSRMFAGQISVPVHVKDQDIEEEMENLYNSIKAHADKEAMVTFSQLCENHSYDNVLQGLFVPMLFLANKERVFLIQDDFFGEIIIKLN